MHDHPEITPTVVAAINELAKRYAPLSKDEKNTLRWVLVKLSVGLVLTEDYKTCSLGGKGPTPEWWDQTLTQLSHALTLLYALSDNPEAELRESITLGPMKYMAKVIMSLSDTQPKLGSLN